MVNRFKSSFMKTGKEKRQIHYSQPRRNETHCSYSWWKRSHSQWNRMNWRKSYITFDMQMSSSALLKPTLPFHGCTFYLWCTAKSQLIHHRQYHHSWQILGICGPYVIVITLHTLTFNPTIDFLSAFSQDCMLFCICCMQMTCLFYLSWQNDYVHLWCITTSKTSLPRPEPDLPRPERDLSSPVPDLYSPVWHHTHTRKVSFLVCIPIQNQDTGRRW